MDKPKDKKKVKGGKSKKKMKQSKTSSDKKTIEALKKQLRLITEKYLKSRLFATKDTTGLFGMKDNRLGGSKTAYKTDYKPQDPNPRQGPINYDAIWDFSAK